MLTDTTYNLALPALIQILRDQVAVLSTTVDILPIDRPCYGYLFLRDSSIIDCQVQSQDGTVLYRGHDAYQILSTKIRWQVRIDAARATRTRSIRPPERSRKSALAVASISDTYVPRVITSLESTLLDPYTMQQRVIMRTVFVMINGQRTVAQMKEQLRLSPEAVNKALISLKAIGVIE